MDGSPSPSLDLKISEEKSDTQTTKKRKMSEKTVVTVKIEANENKKHKNEGPPSDSWSWRKYGQKPIKGSPYPRGYYRCSTSKGCFAKKQVERCRTDASLLIITYTSTHNHPNPKELKAKIEEEQEEQLEIENLEKQEDPKEVEEVEEVKEQVYLFDEDGASENMTNNFHYIHSPLRDSDHQDIITSIKHEDEIQFTETLENVLFDEKEKPLCYPHLMTFTTPKSEENDFFDELGELPTSSSFSSFMRGNFFEDRILIHLS